MADVQRMADIIEEGKAQGSIRPEVNSQETAWRLMAAFWSETTARLFHFEDAVLASGVSAQNLDSILREIATNDGRPVTTLPDWPVVPYRGTKRGGPSSPLSKIQLSPRCYFFGAGMMLRIG